MRSANSPWRSSRTKRVTTNAAMASCSLSSTRFAFVYTCYKRRETSVERSRKVSPDYVNTKEVSHSLLLSASVNVSFGFTWRPITLGLQSHLHFTEPERQTSGSRKELQLPRWFVLVPLSPITSKKPQLSSTEDFLKEFRFTYDRMDSSFKTFQSHNLYISRWRATQSFTCIDFFRYHVTVSLRSLLY